MTIQQADQTFAALPDAWAEAGQLQPLLPTAPLQYVAVAGTAGKTAVARMTAAILQKAGYTAGCYCAGPGPLSGRILVNGAPVAQPYYLAAACRLAGAALPRAAAGLAAACHCFAAAGCDFAVVELADAGLAAALQQLPACAVTRIGPDGSGRSLERLAHEAAAVMRKDTICVTDPEQPKAALTEIIVAAGRCMCELTVPDAGDITFLAAEGIANHMDYGGYEVQLPFIGRHAACNAAIAVELALGLWRKGFAIEDDAILAGLQAVANHSSVWVASRQPLVVLDASHTPQQAEALARVLAAARLSRLALVAGLGQPEGAEAFFAALESGFVPEEQRGQHSARAAMPGMAENPFEKVYLAGEHAWALEKQARFHFDAEACPDLDEALEYALQSPHRGVVVCGGEQFIREAIQVLQARGVQLAL